MATIPEFFAGKNVFLTGVSGFLGKVLVEKLLRSCPEVDTIYVLLREKRGLSGPDRLRKILSARIFDNLRQLDPGCFSKVKHINGDLLLDEIIFSDDDVALLHEKVNIVIHTAASVRFNEPLRNSIEMNLKGTKKLLDFAKDVKKLESFVHVSTAYSNCQLRELEEKTYEAELNPLHAIAMCDWMSEDMMERLRARLLKDRPNTYTFTKALAENLVEEYSKDMPIVVVRPSIITGAAAEPLPGWVDNFNGPNGLLIALGTGALTTLYSNLDCTADLIPVDYVANTILAAAKQAFEGFKIYHCTSGTQNPINWRTFMEEAVDIPLRYPTTKIIRYPSPRVTSRKWLHETRLFLEHYVPARILGAMEEFANIRTGAWSQYQRLSNSMDLLEFFATHEWVFDNTNTQKLFENLQPIDKEQFNFDVRNIDWPSYVRNYCLGIRQYILNVDLNDLEQGKAHLQRLKLAGYASHVGLGYVAWMAYRYIYSFW